MADPNAASRQAKRTERGPGRSAGQAESSGWASGPGVVGLGVRSGKGGGEPEPHGEGPSADRPVRPGPGASRTRANPGFTEEGTKDVEVSSDGGLSQDDPDHSLRGEDQLLDGESRLDPAVEEEEEE